MVSYGYLFKLKDRPFGPFKVLRKYGANAYRIKLSRDLHINPTFNVANLELYYAPDDFHLAP